MQLTILHLLCIVLAWRLVDARDLVCPRPIAFDNSTRIESADPIKSFREISGLAISPKIQAPSGERIVYGINDGGGGNRLGVFDSETGKRLLTYRIPESIITNIDWETLTIGSCGSTGVNSTCIYVGDTGDNPARVSGGRSSRRSTRTSYRILKIKEPNYKNYPDNVEIKMSRFSVLTYNYLDSTSPTKYCDCEAMFLDHTGCGNDDDSVGDLYIVPKWGQSKSNTNNRLFKIPASAWPDQFDGSAAVYSPKAIVADGIMGKVVTSAEMSLDGSVIAIGTTTSTYLYLRCPGVSVVDALAAQPCESWNHPSSGQVESFTWYPDGESALEIPEGNNRRMGWTMLEYDANKSSQACPQG
jgi:hypothetical protein